MQSVEVKGLDELDRDLESILKELPDKRRDLHERIGKALKTEVNTQIDTSGINDSHGTVKGWQESHVGSGGGYVAVRPLKGPGLVGNDSPGALTNYLENGHKMRDSRASGEERDKMLAARRAERLRGRHKKLTVVRDLRESVRGFHFYYETRSSAEGIAISEAERFVDEVRTRLEG